MMGTGLATKSVEQHSECWALNHYKETATVIQASKSNIGMATLTLQHDQRECVNLSKMKDAFMLHLSLDPNLLFSHAVSSFGACSK